MKAAVYRGVDKVVVEELPVPEVGPGELLLRVQACGICGTDLKKVSHGLVPPPRVFGHEMAGVVERVGAGVAGWAPGDRAVAVHHVPCGACGLCRLGAYSQCATYKRTGTTAGFEPAGGGMAQYVRVMDWIVRGGMTRIPEGVSYEVASFLEPVNTCLKAVRKAGIRPGERVLVLGQGAIGLILLQLALLEGAQAYGADLLPGRLSVARSLGAVGVVEAGEALEPQAAEWTGGLGMDATLVAAASSSAVDAALRVTRPGGRVLLFAQTRADERAEVNLGAVCVLEKDLIGSYSSSIDLQPEVEELVFSGRLRLAELVTHRFPIEEAPQAIVVAAKPSDTSLKVVLLPNPESGAADAD